MAGLLEDDEEYLRSKGYAWELVPDGDRALLILRSFPVSNEVFDRDCTDVLIEIPPNYNDAKLDMFWCEPHLRLKSGGLPQAADQSGNYLGRSWQRFSRHLPTWRAGIDGLPTFLTFVTRELGGVAS